MKLLFLCSFVYVTLAAPWSQTLLESSYVHIPRSTHLDQINFDEHGSQQTALKERANKIAVIEETELHTSPKKHRFHTIELEDPSLSNGHIQRRTYHLGPRGDPLPLYRVRREPGRHASEKSKGHHDRSGHKGKGSERHSGAEGTHERRPQEKGKGHSARHPAEEKGKHQTSADETGSKVKEEEEEAEITSTAAETTGTSGKVSAAEDKTKPAPVETANKSGSAAATTEAEAKETVDAKAADKTPEPAAAASSKSAPKAAEATPVASAEKPKAESGSSKPEATVEKAASATAPASKSKTA